MHFAKTLSILTILILSASCGKSSSTTTTDTSTSIAVPTVYLKIYGATSITNDGTYITIKTKDLPDHKSPYYASNNYFQNKRLLKSLYLSPRNYVFFLLK